MTHIEYIKDLYENGGLSLREIAKQTKHDFRTVQKYAYRDNWNPPVEPKLESEDYPVLGEHIKTINRWLENDKSEPRKQRHTIQRIYDRLKKDHDYEGSYSTVKRYVALKKEKDKKVIEGYLPIAQPPGHAQVDFGKFKFYDGTGSARNGYELVVTFPYSNAGWMQVFPSENQECLLTGLKRIFIHIGGVCVQARLDNMTAAVVEVLKGSERVLCEGFIRFKLHYRFKTVFCNPAKGNEKGNVENKVGYVRRNMLVPVPTITDFDGFNEELLKCCDENHARNHYRHGKIISKLWEEEKSHLLKLPEYEYDVFRYESLTVNKSGFIVIDTVRYGLSPEMAGTIVQAKIYFDKVEVYHDRCLLKTFVRSYEKNSEVCDWREYLGALTRKPGAVPHTRFFDQMPKLWQQYLVESDNRERKSALLLLMEIVEDGNECLCDEALELARDNGRTDADSIRQCYYMIAKEEYHPSPLALSSDPPQSGYAPDLTVYDRLFVSSVNFASQNSTSPPGIFPAPIEGGSGR
jgi:transposase